MRYLIAGRIKELTKDEKDPVAISQIIAQRAVILRSTVVKRPRSGGGIRIVLPSVPEDPLLKPGEIPRPRREVGGWLTRLRVSGASSGSGRMPDLRARLPSP